MTVYASSMDRKVNVPSGCRPVFSTYDKNGEHCCILSKPAMTFYNEQAPEMYKTITITNPLSPLRPFIIKIPFVDLVADVYTERWSNIIQEQYNEQNKLLTCYVKLNDMDFRNLTCNRFVRIGNVLYSIYKVNDFQLGVGGLTKVELLQVWDMKKYLGQYYVEPEPEPEPEPVPEPVDLTTPFFVENITDEDETVNIRTQVYGVTNPITVEKSTDKINWEILGTTSATPLTIPLAPGERVYLRANTNTWTEDYTDHNHIIFGSSKIGGNIMSLLYYDDFADKTSLPASRYGAFYHIFRQYDNVGTTYYTFKPNTILQDASELLLPATTLTSNCYARMFNVCTSLTTAPELPATTLANECYSGMFSNCTSLTTAPELPATTLANDCYSNMFYNCTSLNHINCQATDISAAYCTNNWVYNVASSGTFVTPSPLIWTRGVSGIPEGWLVVSGD